MAYPSARTLKLKFDFSALKEKIMFSGENKAEKSSTQEKDLEKESIHATQSCMRTAERSGLSHETLSVEAH